MAEYTLKDIRVAKEMPGYKGRDGTEGAQVLEFTLETADGTQRKAELFTTPKTVLPSVGDKVEGEIEPQDNPNWAPKWVPAGSKKGGGFRGKSPGETKAIQRQHSQHMMLLKEANVIAAGGRPYSEEQQRHVINWMEQDISSKDTSVAWGGFSDDVPVDLEGTPFE